MKDLENILKSIKNKAFLPIYFFHGKEAYYIDLLVKALENNVLTEDEKAFNQTIVYGKDTNYDSIISLAKQFPMMGEYQLIIVKEAQDLKLNDEYQKIFLNYIENPVNSTILVFAHKHDNVNMQKKFAKLLDKKKMLFLSEPVKDYKLAQWIQGECQKMGLKITPNIPQLLAEYIGNDLSRIVNELQKIKFILKDGEVVDEKLIEKHIGISKEYNVFELQKALGTRNATSAMKITHYISKNQKSNPLVMIISNLYTFYSNVILCHTLRGQSDDNIASELKINPFFVKDFKLASQNYPLKHATRAISILREYDLKSKGLGANQTEEAELLKEMVYKLLNIAQMKI
ncbi:MAG: DNA polymerase III subunit delta [Flavobacteriaceae bacterium]|nr:DNA polymerase III subunit delta [Flavobacteriaceae bacterium]